MLRGKKILLGVCGSIAAYKAAHLVRLFIKEQAEVQVIATSSAFSFITPLTLGTLSKRPVFSDFVKDEQGQWNNHVDLGLWADLFIIAPASANTIAKCANGHCDNLLLATYLSAKCPVMFAPAMDLDMYSHPATKSNIDTLRSFGNEVIDAEYGELASGLVGAGRMPEPEHILQKTIQLLEGNNILKGKRVLITAGPTYEAIDPVRFIGNRSSGKMGYAIAEECIKRGASVTVISGPTSISSPTGVNLIKVESAEEMHNAAVSNYSNSDIAILAAAVADYRPSFVFDEKMKKGNEALSISLEKTSDIAKELGGRKKGKQVNIGFALETENEVENAKKKIFSKNLDLIVLNSLKDPGAGFSFDTNKITIIDKHNNLNVFELKSKKEAAADIVEAITKLF